MFLINWLARLWYGPDFDELMLKANRRKSKRKK
jgi:hypothetical protein